jgi:hypothetical protein
MYKKLIFSFLIMISPIQLFILNNLSEVSRVPASFAEYREISCQASMCRYRDQKVWLAEKSSQKLRTQLDTI